MENHYAAALIAGLERAISAGEALLTEGLSMTLQKDRDITAELQSYALCPKYDRCDNMAFTISLKGCLKSLKGHWLQAYWALRLYLDRKQRHCSGQQSACCSGNCPAQSQSRLDKGQKPSPAPMQKAKSSAYRIIGFRQG